jgi:general secretion pathway protein A
MYTSYFGFKENPFNLTPDPRYLFLSPYHREALNHFLYGVHERKGFIVIIGGIGTGKTTLCREFLGQLDNSTKSALIFNSFLTEKELLEITIKEFGITHKEVSGTKNEYIHEINEFLIKNHTSGGNAVLVIDEAQNLSQPVLEQLRMLSNLETEKDKLLQIVLVGQPELKDLLNSSSLRQLNERITVRHELRPLDRKNVRGYVEHRLVVGGGKGDVRFSNAAFSAIYQYSQGNPRRINAVCDRALLIAYAKERHHISKGLIKEAIREIRGDISARYGLTAWPWERVISFTVLLLILFLVAAGFAGWNFREDIRAFFSGREKIAVITTERPPLIVTKKIKEVPGPTLFLDETASLTGLFDLFRNETKQGNYPLNKGHLGLTIFTMEPKHYRMFKKPFRMHLPDSSNDSWKSQQYILIREITDQGAIALDAEGKERPVSKEFILLHWGRQVSWIYPYKNKRIDLIKGMRGGDVVEVQKILKEIGYLIKLTGIYDETTFLEVIKLQRHFGLVADGIVGPQTRALLYLISP